MRRPACPEHHSAALEALHALLVQAGAGACVAAYDAYATPLLLTAIGSPSRRVRQRAARMVGLLIQHVPENIPILLQQFAVAPLLKLLQRSSLAERAEAIDVLYMLRTCPAARRAIAAEDVMPHLASVLAACIDLAPHLLTPDDSAGGALDSAASIGLFLHPHQLGSQLHRATISGKAVRLLVYLARDAETWRCVAGCADLAEPLARLIQASPCSADCATRGERNAHTKALKLHKPELLPRSRTRSLEGHGGGPVRRRAGGAVRRPPADVPAPVVEVPDTILDRIERSLANTAKAWQPLAQVCNHCVLLPLQAPAVCWHSPRSALACRNRSSRYTRQQQRKRLSSS